MDSLTVVFVTYNSHMVIGNCLTQLVSDPTLRIIVVDNNSTDDTPRRIRERFPGVRIIEQKQNIGYGRAANLVLRNTDAPYVLLLNPDMITTTAAIHKLLSHAVNDTTRTAIWSPATLKKDYTGEPPQEVKWVSGSAMLFNVEKIRKVGLFDENIFLFSEDTDLCERTIRAGYEIKLCRDILFNHYVGQSSSFDSKIEYMKWWHFGWSQCYRKTKNGHYMLFRNPWRKYFTYRIHSYIATSKAKRMKWKAKADGSLAYIRGVKAFRPDGSPQFS